MGVSDSALEMMATADTLEGQKRLFAGAVDPNDRLARLNRCLYGPPGGDDALIEDEQERLLERLPKATGSTQATLLYNLGCIALYNDDIQDARQRFAEVLKLDGANRFARHNLAYANELLAEYDQAKTQYNAVVAQDPGMVLSRMNLALLRLQLGEVDLALDDLRALHK
ncbi:MAG TPA: tetratricopeptide repeat protein, partial [bacterium]